MAVGAGVVVAAGGAHGLLLGVVEYCVAGYGDGVDDAAGAVGRVATSMRFSAEVAYVEVPPGRYWPAADFSWTIALALGELAAVVIDARIAGDAGAAAGVVA